MDGRQAYIRPSGAWVWSVCFGYALLCSQLDTEVLDEESDNEVREDGIACHWLAAELWEGRPVSPGTLSPNNREIDDAMLAAVHEYHTLLRSWPTPAVLEQTIPVSEFFPGVSDGTPDAWSYDARTQSLFVSDLKYGFRPVDVWRNVQLIIYAWTLVCMLTRQGHAPQTIYLSIVQPRYAHRDGTTRKWVVFVSELAEYAAMLAAAARKNHEPNPLCVVNPGCRNCPGAYACRTLAAAGGAGMDISYDATPHVLNEQQLAHELARLMTASKHMEHRITGLSTQAESMLRKGKRVPGFALRPSVTRWRWNAGAAEWVRRMGQLHGVDVMEAPKPKSVAQLRGAIPGVDLQLLYAHKPTGEVKLVAVDPNEAIKEFSRRE